MESSTVSTRAITPEEDRRQQFYVQLLQDSRNINSLLDLLAVVVEREDWKRLTDVHGQPLTFRAYVDLPYADGGIGWNIDNLRTILHLQHDQERVGREVPETVERLRDMRSSVEALLLPRGDDLPERRIGRGKPGPGRGNKTPNKISRFSFGTDPDYLTARIARDHPAVLEEMKAGKFKSVRAAAKAAGIVRDPTGLELLRRAWGKANEEERQSFIEWVAAGGAEGGAQRRVNSP